MMRQRANAEQSIAQPVRPSPSGFAEPAMVRIPEGWFWMGCEAGRDDEKPVHRVWVDAFELAACQVTNADYPRFLAATQHPKPLYWDDPNFNHPEQPVVAPSWFDAEIGRASCRERV